MLSTVLECFPQGWNAFHKVGIPLFRVGMLSRGLERFRQSWNTFVPCLNAFDRVGIHL
jgi:ABC-type glycerol-3-phosphate transport system permease component